MKKNILEIKNLCFSYSFDNKKNNNKILDNFSYTFDNEKDFIIIGDNGSGKTTLFDLISGLSFLRQKKKNNISIEFDRLHLNGEKFSIEDVSYFTQNFENTFFNDTIKKEIIFTIENCNTELKYENIVKMYDFFGYDLKNIEHISPFNLNFGEQKLLAFFLSIIKSHKILLLDEIDSAFSLIMKKKIIDFIKNHYRENINKDAIIIVVSHDDYFISRISDEILYF